MRINQKYIILTLVSISLIAGVIFAWNHAQPDRKTVTPAQTNKSTNSVNYSPATNAQKQAGDKTKQDAAATNANPSPQPESGTITISRLSQSTSNTVILRAIVDGITNGTCIATFSKDGQQSVQDTVSVINNATYYGCAPLDIPVGKFATNGTWNVSVHVVNAQNVIISNTATTSVELQ